MTRTATGAEIDRFFSEAGVTVSNQRDKALLTDFAITSIDVPDRLDMQSLRELLGLVGAFEWRRKGVHASSLVCHLICATYGAPARARGCTDRKEAPTVPTRGP